MSKQPLSNDLLGRRVEPSPHLPHCWKGRLDPSHAELVGEVVAAWVAPDDRVKILVKCPMGDSFEAYAEHVLIGEKK